LDSKKKRRKRAQSQSPAKSSASSGSGSSRKSSASADGSRSRSRSGSNSSSSDVIKKGKKKSKNLGSKAGSEEPTDAEPTSTNDIGEPPIGITKKKDQNSTALFGDADDISSGSGDESDAKSTKSAKSDAASSVKVKSKSDAESDKSDKSDDEKSKVAAGDGKSDDDDENKEKEEDKGDEAAAADEVVELPETRIDVEIPKISTDLGKGLHFVKLPNFLSVERRPFDPNSYEDEIDDEETMDEEGRARLKLKVENTIRWRERFNEKGVFVKESNARFVRWSDGSLSLHLGSENF